jgi:hypothetical protein
MADATELLIGGPSFLYVAIFGTICVVGIVFTNYDRYLRVSAPFPAARGDLPREQCLVPPNSVEFHTSNMKRSSCIRHAAISSARVLLRARQGHMN